MSAAARAATLDPAPGRLSAKDALSSLLHGAQRLPSSRDDYQVIQTADGRRIDVQRAYDANPYQHCGACDVTLPLRGQWQIFGIGPWPLRLCDTCVRTIPAPVRLPCQEVRCDYRVYYLASGPAALAHDEYHAQVAEFLDLLDTVEVHQDSCQQGSRRCETCSSLERRSAGMERRLRI